VLVVTRILVTGAFGQIGSELVPALCEKFGPENVVALGFRKHPEKMPLGCTVDFGDVSDREALESMVKKYEPDWIFHLAAILSAAGEKNPALAWNVNMNGTYNVFEAAREHSVSRVIVPSSIAAFGPDTPREKTPNETIERPTTMYGLTKVAGELLGNYYFSKFGLDVRGMRFPGIISSEALPGGGTTDYAVEIFYEALKQKKYACFLKADTYLPMMYMPDALKALLDLAQAPLSSLKHHSDFNVNSMSFCPADLAAEIKMHIPDFRISYVPDFRQKIADSWPRSLDDSAARSEWGWKPVFNLKFMTQKMLERLSTRLNLPY